MTDMATQTAFRKMALLSTGTLFFIQLRFFILSYQPKEKTIAKSTYVSLDETEKSYSASTNISKKEFITLNDSENVPDQHVSNYSIYGNRNSHPALSQECYNYSHLEAINKCCKLNDYSQNHSEGFLKCAVNNSEWHMKLFGKMNPKMHWMFIGDSHIRNIFEIFVRKIRSPMVKYRKASYKEGLWRNIKSLKVAKYQGVPITVKHLRIPLVITFTWDPFLRLLPNITRGLEKGNEVSPSLVLMGTALHWIAEAKNMTQNAEHLKALGIYRDHISSLQTTLQILTARAHVVFKLLDHLQPVHVRKQIDAYNRVAVNVLQSEVTVWDSNIPLSDLYIQACGKNPRNTPKTKTWRCDDKMHTGYVVIDTFVKMLMNFGCNRVLGLSEIYCK